MNQKAGWQLHRIRNDVSEKASKIYAFKAFQFISKTEGKPFLTPQRIVTGLKNILKVWFYKGKEYHKNEIGKSTFEKIHMKAANFWKFSLKFEKKRKDSIFHQDSLILKNFRKTARRTKFE